MAKSLKNAPEFPIYTVEILLATMVMILLYCGRWIPKYILACLYLRYFARRPERRWLTSVSAKRKGGRAATDSKSTGTDSLVKNFSEDESKQQAKFEKTVVELFMRRFNNLTPEVNQFEDEASTRIVFREHVQVKTNKEEAVKQRRMKHLPDAGRTILMGKRESTTFKLNEHGETLKVRKEEVSPVYFYRSSKEKGNVWLEHPRHFSSVQQAEMADLLSFVSFDDEGNSVLLWTLRRSRDATRQQEKGSQDRSNDSKLSVSSQDTECVIEIWMIINIVGVGSFRIPSGYDFWPCNCKANKDAKVGRIFVDAGGLKLEFIDAMNKWKLSYRGLMSKDGEDDQYRNVQVQLAFWWNAVSQPFHFQHQGSNSCVAEAVAAERWSIEFFRKFSNWRLRREIHYSQWGGLRGTLKVNDFSQVMNLKGPRVHFYGKLDSVVNRNATMWIVHSEMGYMMHLETTEVKDVLKNLKIGYMSYPNGYSKEITSLTLENVVHPKESPTPKKWKFNFKADGKRFALDCLVNRSLHISTINEMNIQMATVEMGEARGHALLCLSYSASQKDSSSQKKKSFAKTFQETPLSKLDLDTWTAPLSSPSCVNINLVGLKGSRLAYLHQVAQKNYLVPRGICLTSDALEYHLFHNPSIRNAITLLKKNSIRSSTDLKTECGVVEQLLRETPLLNELKWSVECAIDKWLGEDFESKSFAVRISTRERDGFKVLKNSAGPLLDIKGLDEIFKNIALCWSILYTHDSVILRRKIGLSIDVLASVIIQEMAYPKSCGNISIGDPNSQYPLKIVIQIQAASEPLSTDDKNRSKMEVILSSDCFNQIIIEKKMCQDHEDDDDDDENVLGSIEVSDIVGGSEASNSTKSDFPDEIFIELAQIAIDIAQKFGNGQRLDFAIDELGKKYIHNALPISMTPKCEDWIIMHEFDSSLATNYEIVVKDIILGPVTPLTLSLLMPATNEAYDKIIRNIMFGSNPSFEKYSLNHQNQMFSNVHVMMLASAADIPHQRTLSEISITGQSLGINYEHYHPKLSGWKRLINAINLYKLTLSSVKRMTYFQNLIAQLSLSYDATTTSIRIYEAITRNIPIFMEGHFQHLSCNSAPNLWLCGLMTYLIHGSEEWTPNHSYMASTLLSSYFIEDISDRFKEIITAINENETAREMLTTNPEDFYGWLVSPSSGNCGDLFIRFLSLHGHRGLNELEFIEKTWKDEPLKLVKLLQSLAGESSEIRKSRKTIVGADFGHFKRLVISFLLSKICECLKLRDSTKSSMVFIHSKFKEAYWALSDKMVKEGRIPHLELMFFLTHHEIGTLLLTRNPQFISLAWARKGAMESLKKATFPNMCVAFNNEKSERSTAQDGVIMRGTPVWRGEVTAAVRVINLPSDAESIQKGEIVVAPFFEITWSWCAPFIAGIITETGGLLSNGAVLARKYGMPCVIGINEATTNLETGDVITLDGHAGIVQRIKKMVGVEVGTED